MTQTAIDCDRKSESDAITREYVYEKWQEQTRKAEEDEVVKQRDLLKLQKHIDEQIALLKV